jgi:hypothetical protein
VREVIRKNQAKHRERHGGISQMQYGSEHPRSIRVQHGLAITLTDMGELEAARKLIQDEHKSYEKIFGPDHPQNMNIVTNLASVFSLEGDMQRRRVTTAAT